MALEIDELDSEKKPSINWNSNFTTGIVLMAVGLLIFVGGLMAGILFYFPLFILATGIGIFIKALIDKNKNKSIDRSKIIDDLNGI